MTEYALNVANATYAIWIQTRYVTTAESVSAWETTRITESSKSMALSMKAWIRMITSMSKNAIIQTPRPTVLKPYTVGRGVLIISIIIRIDFEILIIT